ncbi:hypothetical protein GS931_12405 [Rhodococcus hoagii]|nr:hypothetical protein [Prescottella equi]
MNPTDANGTVQFKENGANIGSPVTVTNGVATLDHVFNNQGTRSISASFLGRARTRTRAVQRKCCSHRTRPNDQDTTTVMTSPASAVSGTAVNLSAQVSGAPAFPGTVQFFDNNAPIGDAVTVNSSGVAVLSHTFHRCRPAQHRRGLFRRYRRERLGRDRADRERDGSSAGPGGTGSLGSLNFGS